MKLFIATLVLFLTPALSIAKEKPVRLGASSIALLEKNIELDNGYGKGYFYSLPDDLSQNLVNQGFAMLNLFQYTDAFRSFDTALENDPGLKIAIIGRAFSAFSLDAGNTYYTDMALDYLSENLSDLEPALKGWGDLLSSLVKNKGLNGQPLSSQRAYQELKNLDTDNLDVKTFANWVSKSHNMSDFRETLTLDPVNAGALHYMLHMAEGESSAEGHLKALGFGERLIKVATSSAHAQHMYGHVLPHFNRWNEADKQFTVADGLHLSWAEKNGVAPSEDWHYYHNLDLWSVSKMVVDPQNALGILATIQSLNPYAILDYLDYSSATFPASGREQISSVLDQIESQSAGAKNLVLSSRLYFDIVFNPTKESFNSAILSLNSDLNFKNRRLLYMFLSLMQTKESNPEQYTQLQMEVVGELRSNFERGGFDGWKKSVLEALMYKRLFELYGMEDGSSLLEENIFNVFMKPVD